MTSSNCAQVAILCSKEETGKEQRGFGSAEIPLPATRQVIPSLSFHQDQGRNGL